MKKIYFLILVIVLLIPSVVVATPTSWDFVGTVLQPLRSMWSSEVKVPSITATSTTQSSTFASRVGVGSTTPYAKLSVQGDADIRQFVLKANGTQTNSIFDIQNSSGTSLWQVNGSGGFQNSTAARGLSLGGTFHTNDYNSINSSGQLNFRAAASDSIGFFNVNTQRMIITSAGNVGIGTTTPAAALGVRGNIFANNITGTNFYSTSTSASTFPYASSTALTATTVCLSTDCRTSWPAEGAGSAFPFLTETNYGLIVNSTTSPLWFRNQIFASSSAIIAGSLTANNFIATGTASSIFTYASTTALSSGNAWFTGKLGIGTTTTTSALDVNGGVAIGTYAGWMSAPANGLIVSGKVGIGDTSNGVMSPNNPLQIASALDPMSNLDTGSNYNLSIQNTTGSGSGMGTGISFLSSNVNTVVGASVVFVRQGSGSFGDLLFATKPTGGTNTERLRITSTGNLGIGTTTPGQKLSVAGDILGNEIIGTRFHATGTTASTFPYASTTALSATTLCLSTDCRTAWPSAGGGDFPFITTTNYGLTVNSTTSPLWFRDQIFASSSAIVAGSVTANNFVATGTASSIFTYASTTALSSGNAWFTGNVGIGTTVPSSVHSLEVNGSTKMTGGDGGSFALDIYKGTSAGPLVVRDNVGYFQFGENLLRYANSSLEIQAQSAGTYIALSPSSAEAMRLTSTGNVGIGTTLPTSKLSVAGSAAGTTLTTFQADPGASILNTNTTANNFSSLDFRQTNSAATVLTSSKIVGVHTSHTSASESGDLAFLTMTGGTISEKMRITGGGNTGIATTTPQAPLHVAGELLINPNGTGNANFRVKSGDGAGDWSGVAQQTDGRFGIYDARYNKNPFYIEPNGANSALVIKPTVATFGVGTQAPYYQGTGGGINLYPSGASLTAIAHTLYGGDGASFAARTYTLGNGNTGFGTSTPNAKINVYGGGIQLDPGVAAKPTCSVATRGHIWNTFGGAGVADTYQVCQKDAADAYAWVTK